MGGGVIHNEFIYKGAHTITPYLTVRGCKEAIEFYKKVFGAKEKGIVTMPDGSIAHAEVEIEGSLLMMAEENPAWNTKSPLALGGTAVNLCLYVTDVDAVFKKAIDAGATQIMPVADMFYGDRTGSFLDPYGHNWMVTTHKIDVTFEEMQKGADKMFRGEK